LAKRLSLDCNEKNISINPFACVHINSNGM